MGQALLPTQKLSSKPHLTTDQSGGRASSLPPPLSFSFLISHMQVSGGVPRHTHTHTHTHTHSLSLSLSLSQGLCKDLKTVIQST